MSTAAPTPMLQRFVPPPGLAAQLANRSRRTLAEDGLRPSAVAILLAEEMSASRALWVPLILRPADAPTHQGQVALPGGGFEARDVSLGATAQREAFEELGIPPQTIDVIASLDDVPTPAGYCITPVLCAFDLVPFSPCAREVAAWFWTPLALFANPSNAEFLGERQYRGVAYQMRAYPWQEQRVWGATARILEQVAQLLMR